MPKTKQCSFCKKEVLRLFYSKPQCCPNWDCRRKYKEQQDVTEKSTIHTGKRSNESGKSSKQTRYSSIRPKRRKATGELALFLRIYASRNATCEITGRFLAFDLRCFAHILPKSLYNQYRLNEDNIIMVLPEIHDLLDFRGEEKLLGKYPKAKIILERRERLHEQYKNDHG